MYCDQILLMVAEVVAQGDLTENTWTKAYNFENVRLFWVGSHQRKKAILYICSIFRQPKMQSTLTSLTNHRNVR